MKLWAKSKITFGNFKTKGKIYEVVYIDKYTIEYIDNLNHQRPGKKKLFIIKTTEEILIDLENAF